LSVAGQESPRPSRGIAFTNWLLSRTTRALERGTSRRGFLIGSAMVGTAVAVAGVDYATRPGTAYGAITDCPGGMCTDGYTEFCCAINSGINACPPGSFAGGWWRADTSSFCGGGTRYYIDCMQTCCGPSKNYCQSGYCFCESCVECQCAGNCNTRRVYCNYFRYGQCHTEIPVSGPIACRVVSCVAPYSVAEYACLTTPAVDNSTAEHAPNCAVNISPPGGAAALMPAIGAGASSASGKVALVVRGGGGAVYYRDYFDSQWAPYGGLGGVVTSGPTLAAAGNVEYVLARGGDNALWANRRVGGATSPWSGWHSLGGLIKSDPVAVPVGTDIAVLGRGFDDGCYVNRYNGSTWSGFTALGGRIDSEPAAVQYQSGIVTVARGIDGFLYANRFTGSWSGWSPIGMRTTANPACAVDGNGVHVFARDTAGAIRYSRYNGNWSAWSSLGGSAISDPVAAADSTGVHVVVLGAGNGLWHNRVSGGVGSGWGPMGGIGTTDPLLVADGARTFTFVRGTDGGVWEGQISGVTFSGWGGLGGVVFPVRA
jgi:hypothetical protein